jgi:hypothetical protein
MIHPPILTIPAHPVASGWALVGSVTCTSNSRLAPRKGERDNLNDLFGAELGDARRG